MKQYYKTVCPYDCGDCCGMIATVEDSKITKISGDPDHPLTKGFLCRKMQHYERDIYSPDRIMTPFKRVGAKGSKDSFVPISWDEAVATICDRWKNIIEHYGAGTIVPYSFAGTMGLIQRNTGEAFFNRMGGAILERAVCGTGRATAFTEVCGAQAMRPLQTIVDNDFILLYSDNPKATRIHLTPYLIEAHKRGARIVMVDVYANISANLCDEVILVRPGTDSTFLLAVMHELDRLGMIDEAFVETYATGFAELESVYSQWTPERASEICGVDPAVITALATDLGQAKSPVLVPGYGMSRYTNANESCRLLASLPVVIGAWSRKGGIAGTSGSSLFSNKAFVKGAHMAPNTKRVTINMNQLSKYLLDPAKPIRSLYVYHSNPAAMAPTQQDVIRGLISEDLFLVVHDRFFSDTAIYADIILPAPFSVEQDDVFDCFGAYHTQVSRKVIDPPGECRSNWDTYRALAKGMGYDDDFFNHSAAEMIDAVIDDHSLWGDLLTDDEYEHFRKGHAISVTPPENRRMPMTSDKKYHLAARPNDYRPLTDNKYPLRMVCSHSPWSLNTNFSYNRPLMEAKGGPTLRMNAEDAMSRGLADGDLAWAYNDFGRMRVRIKIWDGILPGTTNAEGVHQKDWCYDGHNFCSLTSSEVSDSGRGPLHNNSSIEVCKES